MDSLPLRHQGSLQFSLAELPKQVKGRIETGHIFFLSTESFPGGPVVKNLPATAGDVGDTVLIPGLEIFPGAGNGNPLQYSCLENPMEPGRLPLTGFQRVRPK